MNCPNCGTPNEAAARFCASCGKPQQPPQPQPAAQQQPPRGPNPFASTALMAQSPAFQQRQQQPLPQQPAQPPAQPQPPAWEAQPQQWGAQAPQQPAQQQWGQAAQPAQQAAGATICGDCGADLVMGQCERCGGNKAITAPAPSQGIHWVQLRLAIKCMTCQRASPLHRLDMEGRYYCYGCGREQLFDADLWKERVLFLASGLGDAFWSNAGVFAPWPTNEPEEDFLDDQRDRLGGDTDVMDHLFKKCREIGRTTGGLTIEQGGMTIGAGGMRTRGCDLKMSPGHPLCPQCKTPLGTQTPSDGVVQASCSRCNTHETYRAPPAAKGACADFFGVISPEHVDGREVARLVAQPGSAAVAVSCPKCGSGLQLAPGARVTNCPYCKTTSVVPDHVAVAGAPPGVPDPVWLAFRSPSTVRNVLHEAAQATARNAASAAAKERSDAEATASERRAEMQRKAAEQARASQQVVFRVAGAFAITSVVTGAVLYQEGVFGPHKAKSDSHATSSGHGDSHDTTTSAKTTSRSSRSDPVAIPSCKCAFGDGQSTPLITLQLEAPPSDASRTWLLEIERQSGFISESRSVKFPQQAGAVMPPAADAGAPAQMGIACDTGVFALVAGKTATGWSSVNGSWKWNATLPAAAIDGADAGASPIPGTDYEGGCAALPVKNGAATLTLANGHHASLSLKDGKVR